MRSLLVSAPFWLYRHLLSPMIHAFSGTHAGCRFEPTCSRYAEDAIRVHGPFPGGWLALKRLISCHPFSRGGFDPVPRYGIACTRKVSHDGP